MSSDNDKCLSGSTSTCEIQTIDGTERASDMDGQSTQGSVVWNTADLPSGISAGPVYVVSSVAQTRLVILSGIP